MKNEPKHFWHHIINGANKYEVLILILTVVVMLRIPTLFEPHRYADEEIYLTLGQGIRKGLVLYRDIHDNKPPLLYLTAAIAGNLFWFRFILLMANLIQVVVFYKLAELVFNKKTALVTGATLLLAVFSTIPMFEGNIANAENFFIVATTAGVYLLYQTLLYKRQEWWRYGLVGGLFTIGFLYKVPVGFDFVGMIWFWWLVTGKESAQGWWRFWINWRLWLTVAALAIPILLTIGYYASLGAAEPYVKSALLQNVGYLSSWRGDKGILASPLAWRGLIILAAMGGLWWKRKSVSKKGLLVVTWTLWALYGALLSSRPYPHYWLQMIPPLALAVPLLIAEKGRGGKLVIAGGLLLSVWWYGENKFWYYKTLPYYQNFLEYMSGQKNKEEYFGFWQGVQRNYKIAEYISKRTLNKDRIFIWGTEPAIYTLTNRSPVGRYVVEYHVVDFKAYEETMRALTKEKPVVIVMFPETRQFMELEALVAGDSYMLEEVIDGARVYRHVNGLL